MLVASDHRALIAALSTEQRMCVGDMQTEIAVAYSGLLPDRLVYQLSSNMEYNPQLGITPISVMAQCPQSELG